MTQINNQMVQQQPKKQGVIEYKATDGTSISLDLATVQNYLIHGSGQINQKEFAFVTALCKARRLNPFTNEAYIVKYNNSDPAQILVSKNFFISRAEMNPAYNGKEQGIIVEDINGNITERNGTLYLDGEKVVGGWCKVYRKDRQHPEYITVTMKEYAKKKKDGSFNTFWANMPGTMIEKVAMARALREAFPNDFSGLYLEEEMDSERQPQMQPEPQQESFQVDPMDIPPENNVIEAEFSQNDMFMEEAARSINSQTREVDINSL